jgi:LPXTG-motif cell wall-anchored protein
MSTVQDYLPCHRRIDRVRIRASLLLVGVGVLAATQAPAALAAPATKPSVPAGFTIAKVADAPKSGGNCDDLGFLDGHLFMGCQDKTTSSGGGGDSTLVEYTTSGTVVQTWSIHHKIDGLAGDPLTHKVILTLDEDANTLMATVAPAAPAGQQVTYYNYSPDPRGATTPTALRTGGGTDHVSVDAVGHVFVTGSHAGTSTGTAVFKVALTPPSSPSGMGTATLSPTFLDNATATKGNMGNGTVPLHLGDVDSGAIVPTSSPRFGGSYVITDQTALELVFANNIFNGSGLTVLKTTFGLDDLLWTTAPAGTLYVVDLGVPASLPKTAVSSLWKVTGPFTQNTVLASNDGAGDQVVKVNLTTGALTPFVQHLNTTKGLLYLNPDGSQTALTPNGAAAVPASSTTTKPTSTTAKQSTGSSNTALIVIIIVVVLALLGGGAYALMRRRSAT